MGPRFPAGKAAVAACRASLPGFVRPSRYVGPVAFPGPAELGRGAVVLAGKEPPDPWKSSPRVAVSDAELKDPSPVVEVLHRAWLARHPVVVELAADPALLRAPQRYDGPVHALTPEFRVYRRAPAVPGVGRYATT